ncbi:MAG: 3-phosphoshikimate 1-carboxyvinyltransferase [Muribaculaceae bacterium]|nr:3-phosphoshikimate 1-carboxyvinyltransferase [Muribaculaceae bacterium]
MDYIILPPEEINEIAVNLPLSKSVSNRILIISALTDNAAPLPELAECDDTRAIIDAFADPVSTEINVGAAGTAMRFLTAFYAQNESENAVVIDGSERMRQRPIGPLVDALRQLGADIEYLGEEGFPPLKIKGKRLLGGEIELDASVSSQFVSALMMIAPKMTNGLRLRLAGEVVSAPYIVMTQRLMEQAGATVDFSGGNLVTVAAGKYRPTTFTVDADWSAAAFWMEIAALSTSEFDLNRLSPDSLQGDREAMRYFEMLGVESEKADGALHVAPSPEMHARLTLDLCDNPDLAQPLAVTACMLGIPFRLSGLSTLRDKETDRLAALVTEMEKITFDLYVDDDALVWDGERHPIESNFIVFDTYNDHRMAMALAPIAIYAPGIVVRDIDVVKKSYPDYWNHLTEAGFTLVDPTTLADKEENNNEEETEE